MFKEKYSRVECRSLGWRGEMVWIRVREKSIIIRLGLKQGMEGNKKQSTIKNPLLYIIKRQPKLRCN